VTLLYPAWLLLALAVPVIWFVPRTLRDARLGLLRSLVLLLVALGAARPVVFTPGDDAVHVVVLDAQGSTDDAAEGEAQALVRRIAGAVEGRSVLVRVGARKMLAEPAAPEDLEAFDRVLLVEDMPSTSSLSRGLEAAARAIPTGARGSVTLVSDGLATDRRWARAVEELQSRGVPVNTIELPRERLPVRILGVDVPDTLRVGHVARVGVRLEGRGIDVDVHLGEDPEVARAERVHVDGTVSVPLEWEPTEAGVHALRLRVHPTGEPFDADRHPVAYPVLAIQEPLRVLYLGERMAEGGPNLSGLVGAGFRIEVAADDVEALEERVRRSDVVVLDDRPAETVPASVQHVIREAVEAGETGLFMAGGRASFGAGGWQRSPLAEILPVELVQKEEKRDPSTTLVVIIDTSGSMGGNRVQLAKEVARLAIRRLLPHDKVGIVEFYGAKRWAAPIQPASNAIEIQRALNRLNAGGGTVIMPAIEEAFYGLQNVQTRYKHVLVLTDGGVETGAFEPLLRRMAEKGITVSTVLIGGDTHSEFLVNLANWGKGRFYGVPNRFNLPEILLKQPASAHLPAWRPGSHAVTPAGGSGWWGEVTAEQVPPLGGYVETRARPGATTLLEVASARHPVLATWRYGVGRVTAFMTEPTGPGTESWRDWAGYGAWLARVLARTASDTRRPYEFTARYEEGQTVVTATQLLPGAAPPAAWIEVAGTWTPLAFRRRAPDAYEAHHPGTFPAAVRGWAGDRRDDAAWVAPEPDWTWEHQEDPARALDLVRVASSTGGTWNELALAQDFVPLAGGGDRPVDVLALWPWCLLLALLVWLLELLYRRLPRSGGARP